jgi:hypothetical protein
VFGFYCAPCIERKRLSIESTGMTGKGDTTDGLQYPMVDLFTGGTMLPLMFVNAAATCYLLSLTAPLAFMAAWTKVLEVSIPPTAWPPNLPDVKMQRTSPHDRFDPTADLGCAVPSATRHSLQCKWIKRHG